MPPSPDLHDWTDRVRAALSRYSDGLLRASTGGLVKPKIGQSTGEIIDRVAEAQLNAPVIDRRLRELPPAAQALVRILGLSRQSEWTVGHGITLAAALGHSEGFTPVETLLRSAIAYPGDSGEFPIDDFPAWFGQAGSLAAPIFLHPAVLSRARGLNATATAKPRGSAATADGLEWPLRIAAAWQRSRPAPVKTTQSKALFKRDLTRLQNDALLNAPLGDRAAVSPDAGILAFEWAVAAGLFRPSTNEYVAIPAIVDWTDDLRQLLTHLFSRFFAVESWDPRRGYLPGGDVTPQTATAALVVFDQLARSPSSAHAPAELADVLWEHHPSWQSVLTREDARNRGADWVDALLTAVAYPLQIVERPASDPDKYRLSEFGRHLLCSAPEPPAPPLYPQTLTVQPNAEMIVYRQGLSPRLIAELSRFAAWKQLGPACTLELNAEETYRGLESGLTLAVLKQTLDRHAMRPLPPNVADLLSRWADKRERITVFPSATLVEFLHASELDLALSRGLVSIKLTDRIGLTADGRDPDFKALRLIGNREYDARAVQCLSLAPDGLTLSVDPSQADLLLDAEIARLAEPIPANGSTHRLYRLTPAKLRAACERGMTPESIDHWLETRSGAPLSPAGRLFLANGSTPAPISKTCRIVRLPSEPFADGLAQWPETTNLLRDRLGPTTFVIDPANLDELTERLASLGIPLTVLE
jgi:hypothetical protein